MERITSTQFYKTLAEFNKVPGSNRNANDLRLGQFLCNFYGIVGDGTLFYTEDFNECVQLFAMTYMVSDESETADRD